MSKRSSQEMEDLNKTIRTKCVMLFLLWSCSQSDFFASVSHFTYQSQTVITQILWKVLLVWTLSNVCLLLSLPQFLFTHYLRNIGSTRGSRCVCLSSHISGEAITHSYFRSFTGDATHKTAEKTVNGYLTFLLFSVAGLACKSYVPSFCFLMVNLYHFCVLQLCGLLVQPHT